MEEEGAPEGTAVAEEVTMGIGGAKGLGRGTRRTGSTILTLSGRGDSMTRSGIDGCESVVRLGNQTVRVWRWRAAWHGKVGFGMGCCTSVCGFQLEINQQGH